MSISVSGNSLVVDNCTLTLNNAFDPTTGIATLTITPSGGLGTLPALVNGTPGLPPGISIGTVTTLSAGASATATLTQLTAGGAGVASTYSLNLGIPAGATGSSGSYTIASSTDYAAGSSTATTSAPSGLGTLAIANGFTLMWNSSTSKFNPVPPPKAAVYFPTSISATSGNSAGPRLLSQIVIPAQPYNFFPVVSGQCIVSGTVNTQVHLYSYITNSSGQQIGVGFSAPGTANQAPVLTSGVPAGSSSTYGQISAGTTATIVLYAQQVASTTDAWTTSSATTSFQVAALPV